MCETQGTGNFPYNWNSNETYCIHRLPCGYCKELNRMCPLLNSAPSITWSKLPEITCEVDGNG